MKSNVQSPPIPRSPPDPYRSMTVALLLLVVGVTAIIVGSLDRTNQTIQKLYSESVRGVELSGDLIDETQSARLYCLYVLNSRDPKEQLEALDHSRASDPRVQALLSTHSQIARRWGNFSAHRELKEAWDSFRIVRDEVLSLAMAGDREKGLQLDRTSGLAAFERLHHLLQKYGKTHSQQAEIRLRQIRDAAHRNILVVTLLLAIVSVGAGLALRSLRRKAELLRQSQERFELAVAGSRDGLWDWDLATDAAYFSPQWKRMLGYDEHELAGDFSLIKRLTHPEDQAPVQNLLKQYLEGSSAIFEAEFRMLHKDGSFVWVLSRGAALRNARGSPYRMAGSHTDITRRRRVDAERARLMAILEAAPDFIGSTTRDGRILYLNRAAREMIGKGPTEDVSACTPLQFHPEWVTRLFQEVALPAAELNGLWMGETTIFRGDGSEATLSQAIIAHRNPQGVVEYFSTIARDITALKQAQKEMQSLHHQLLESSRLAGMAEVATSVLHNVGNVLNSVNVSAGVIRDRLQKSRLPNLGSALGLLRDNIDDLGRFFTDHPKGRQLLPFLERLQEHLVQEDHSLLRETDLLDKSVQHIKEIVSAQQSFTRVIGATENVDPGQLLQDALNIVGPSTERHGIRVVKDFAQTPLVLADRHKMMQILINFLRNAKQSLQSRSQEDRCITLKVRATEEHRIRLSVHDNGDGNAPENLAKIFRHGFTTKSDGHGFGLHASANAAREMGGSLNVQSDGRGRGATFTLELPVGTVGASPTSSASRGETS